MDAAVPSGIFCVGCHARRSRRVAWEIMREINYVDIRHQPFDASKWDLASSGLLGPVRLVPLTPINPR